MPRKPRIPKYSLHKPSGRARVILDGQHIWLGKYGSEESVERYNRLVAELCSSSPTLPVQPGAELTITEVISRYWKHCQGYYVLKDGQPSGWLDHIQLVLRLLRETYGRTQAGEFGPKRFKAFRQTLVGAGHSRKYINKLAAIVLRMFKWAASEELLPNSVHLDLRSVEGLKMGRCAAPERPPVLPVDDTVVDATLTALPAVIADMVALQRLTGMRPAEVCILRPCDVNREESVWTFRPAAHKTEHFGRERIVYVGPQGQQILARYLLRESTAYCFSPSDSEQKRHAEMRERRKSRVQPSQLNRRKKAPKRQPKTRYSADSYRRAIHRAVDKINAERTEAAEKKGAKPELLEKWAPNRLRHNAGTKVRRQFGLEAAQVCLGHASADVTQVYAERDAELARSVALKIG